jgi:hypothetical protein
VVTAVTYGRGIGCTIRLCTPPNQFLKPGLVPDV